MAAMAESGAQSALMAPTELLASQHFRTIKPLCDAAGLGAMRAARDHGVAVPGDLSVTGFDGLDFARYCVPSLTTVVQPTEEIARETSRFLVRAVTEGTRAFSPLSIRGELLVGESTGAVRA